MGRILMLPPPSSFAIGAHDSARACFAALAMTQGHDRSRALQGVEKESLLDRLCAWGRLPTNTYQRLPTPTNTYRTPSEQRPRSSSEGERSGVDGGLRRKS